jgi:two-component system phosphate regulon sensor histidine kinase PhoR
VFISVLLINKGLLKGLNIVGGFADRIRTDTNTPGFNNYDEKIGEFNSLYQEFVTLEKKFSVNRESAELYNSFNKSLKRTLDELNNAKIIKVNRNEFLGNVTHELRTPIFAVQLSLETLIDGAVNDPAVNLTFLEKALQQTNRMTELVDDLINISRLEAGMKLSKRYFPVNKLINDTITEMKALAVRKQISLTFEQGTDDESSAFADAVRIKQVLMNLIENATKYTQAQGKIIISTSRAGKSINISVADTGIGIPEDDLPRIFERFYRVDKNRSRDMGGSGLGLSIVKHILELHNIKIEVSSEVNKGTKFEFSLPA